MRKLIVVAFAACLAVLLSTSQAFAQAETGQIVGTMTDQSGAVVPGAKVTVKNVGTGAERLTETDNSGSYIVTNLQPAIYEVTVEKQGFAKTTRRVQVTVGSKVALDIVLTVTAASEVVEVVAAAGVAINTETQTLGTVIDTKKLETLPLLTRDPYDLIGTSGNVNATADAGLTSRGGGFNVNGLRAASNNILLDGASNNDEFTAGVGQAIPLDAVQEFSVLTNNFTAEYGRAAGGVVNVVTKSGTNAFHGTAYEFGRYSRLAANTFDNNARGINKPVFTRNQFGYSVGGPAIKDKLFFFQSTEWLRVRSSAPTIVYIPTPQLLAASNANTQAFFNAATVRPNTQSLGTFSRSQLIARGFDPCSGSAAGGPCQSFPAATPMFSQLAYSVPSDSGAGLPRNSYQVVGRADWNVSSKTQLYGRYALQSDDIPAGANVNSVYSGFDTGFTNFNHNFAVSLTHSYSPRFVSQSKLSFNRLSNVQPLGTAPVQPSLYMLANVGTTILGNLLNFPGYTPFNPGNAVPFGGPQNNVQALQDLSYTKGKHQFRFGGSYVYIRDNRTFGAYEEAVETLSTSSFGAGMDRFLNGVLRQFQVAVDPQGNLPCDDFRNPATVTPNCSITLPASAPQFSRSNRYHEFAFYGQDSLKVAPRVTLNLGLRWEYFGVQHNKNPLLDSNYYDANAGDIFHSIRQGNISVAQLSATGGLWHKNWHNFGPRAGFAWDVFGNGKTSIRGGYGISYERNFGNVTFNVIQNPPGYLVVSLVAPVDIASLPITTNNFGPLAGTSGSQGLPKASMRNVNPNIRNAYTHFYSLSVEREVFRNVIVAVDYSGSKGVNLYTLENPNRIGSGNVFVADPCTPVTQTDTRTGQMFTIPAYPCFNSVTFTNLLGQSFTVSKNQMTRLRNTQVTNINRRGDTGLSLYNGVNGRVDVRNVGNTGLTLRANYTYSHAVDNLSSTFSESGNNNNLGLLDPFNPKLDRGPADFDARHRVVVSGTWDIPFARIPFARDVSNAIAKRVLDGWTVAPIFTAHTGVPFTVYDCGNAFVVCPRAMVPISSRPAKSGVDNVPAANAPNTFNYINLASIPFNRTYTNPIAGVSDFGQYPSTMLPRNYFRAPGAYNVDFGIYKTTKVSERLSVQFRAEMFNLLNHSDLFFVPSDNDLDSVTIVRAKRGVRPPALGTVNTSPPPDERRNIQLAVKLIF